MGSLWIKVIGVCFYLNYQCIAEDTGTIIPLYIYPTTKTAWQPLYDSYKSQPINTWAIVNVNSGPGTLLDSNYGNAIDELHSSGIKSLGYVRTDYARQSQATVKAEIDRWKQYYSPHGIFFDEMAYDDDDQKVQYYRDIGNYAKQQSFNFTVGNPGTRTSPRYFNTVDNIVIYESDTGIPNSDLICSQNTTGYGRNSVSVLSYNIANLDANTVRNLKSCAGYIFVTDDSGSNPWDSLPKYLTQLFQVLRN
ncbi:spherulin-4-like [Bradysia coprophila]|uniref:spherulin-4-like n=1 Tax=Bradysia coprophila TaxID=38358 RepID=UPI00187D7094|nr:spherulin-4-like [Bradysia coprophila]